jgi:hypothetical protein
LLLFGFVLIAVATVSALFWYEVFVSLISLDGFFGVSWFLRAEFGFLGLVLVAAATGF